MAQYVLQLTCILGTSADDNEGVFDTVNWVSVPSQNNLPAPATAALDVDPGDSIGFAVRVVDNAGNAQNGYLDWVTIIVTAATTPGNRGNRLADNNSPFRIGSASKPNTVLISTKAGAGNTDVFQGYDNNGNAVSTGATFLGMGLEAIVADVPPGASSPNRNVSQYEAVVVCSLTDSGGNTWQFAYDPEMDVNNNN